MVDVVETIGGAVFPPRYGPEWGSGGIFGLKYYRGVLYFTLAFEALAYFVRDSGSRVYDYSFAGPGPRSGGDTYNAVEAVDEYIYFGGWVHAPAVYTGRKQGRGAEISFRNKYSHVHAYNIDEDKVELLWREGLNDDVNWVGEVSEIVYDPVNDRLLLARGDGMVNLGVYQIDRRGGGYSRLSEVPAQKGSYFYDYICFDMFRDWVEGVIGVQCVDLVENRVTRLELGDISRRSADGFGVGWRLPGVAVSAYGRFFLFIRGGLLAGNPVDESIEALSFYRLFDFGLSGYSPRRTMVKPIRGGILVAFNSYSEALIRPTNEAEALQAKATNSIAGPSVMLFISPPIAKIVAVFGARVTAFETIGSRILIAYNTMANTFRYDASPIDTGLRGFTVLGQEILDRDPPPIRFIVRGFQVGNKTFGGIPLTGYREPRLVVDVSRDSYLEIYEYDLSLPLTQASRDTHRLYKGRNIVDLRGYRNSVVSFRLVEEDQKAVMRIDLA